MVKVSSFKERSGLVSAWEDPLRQYCDESRRFPADKLLIRPASVSQTGTGDLRTHHSKDTRRIGVALVSSHEDHQVQPDRPLRPASGYSQHTYVRSTAGTAGAEMTVEVTFDVIGRTSTSGVEDIGQISRTSPSVFVTVGEIQAIETSGT